MKPLQTDPGESCLERKGPKKHLRKAANFSWETKFLICHKNPQSQEKFCGFEREDFKIGKRLRLKSEIKMIWCLKR